MLYVALILWLVAVIALDRAFFYRARMHDRCRKVEQLQAELAQARYRHRSSDGRFALRGMKQDGLWDHGVWER